MKRWNNLPWMTVLSLLFICHSSQSASAAPRPGSGPEIGGEVYYYFYEEPNFAELEGVYYGVNGTYTHRVDNPMWVWTGEVRAAFGDVDYASNGTGSANGIDDFVVEPRGWLGFDVEALGGYLTPYFGAGYRYLQNDMNGVVTTTGARGYERRSQYFYSPAGIEYATGLAQDWRLEMAAEYDIFWTGVQESDLSQAVSAFNDLQNDQEGGFGVRASVRFVKQSGAFDIVIEPFFRYWKVDESETSTITIQGVAVGYGLEPENQTYEAGGKISIRF